MTQPTTKPCASEQVSCDQEYQKFVDSVACYCHCEHPHPKPCDGVLAGGVCDELVSEPDFTMDELD